MSVLGPNPVFKDLLIQASNTGGDRQDCAIGLQREVAPLLTTTDLGVLGSVRSVRTCNSMCPINFSAKHIFGSA